MKAIKGLGFILFMAISSLSFNSKVHDFHSSTTKIALNNQSNLLSITSRFFTDDLEKGVGVNTDNPRFESAIKSYVNKNFKLNINGSLVKIDFVGVQSTDKATRVFLEVKNVNDVNSIEIINTFLLETFNNQQNIMDIDINGKDEGVVLSKQKTKIKFQFN